VAVVVEHRFGGGAAVIADFRFGQSFAVDRIGRFNLVHCFLWDAPPETGARVGRCPVGLAAKFRGRLLSPVQELGVALW